MARELLIVGIDPGITTAYAVLDAQGNLLKLKSSKRFTLSTVINEILAIDGKVIIVGSDVKYPPQYIQKFSTAFSAKLLSPKEDMKIGLKERMTQGIKTNDDHQRDALAAALFALNEIRPLFQKVDAHLKREGKEHLTNEVKKLTVKGMGIVEALERLEAKEITPPTRKRTRQKIKKSKRVFEENDQLRKHNTNLLAQITALKERIKKLERTLLTELDARVNNALEIKERKISSLYRLIDETKHAAEILKKENDQLIKTLLNLRGKMVVKRFRNLGKDIIPYLQPSEIIYIDDPSSVSEATIEFLIENDIKIASKVRPPQELQKRITTIDVMDFDMQEHRIFIVINKSDLEKERTSKDILQKVVTEYKESRV